MASVESRVELRTAVPEDAEDIARVINAAYQVERFFVDGDRTSPGEVRRLMAGGAFLLVADASGSPAGCVYVEVRGARGYFGLLAVDPGRQGQGIGRKLVAAAEDHCRKAGCKIMDLQVVDVRAELPPLYRSLGYAETGTAPFTTPSKIPCRFVLMSKALVPGALEP
jgi:GNAT superfamily N-acetyltransferase